MFDMFSACDAMVSNDNSLLCTQFRKPQRVLRFFLSVLITSVLSGQVVTQSTTGDGHSLHPLLPCLFSTRATTEMGSSLVLLDQSGQETVVDSDPRTSKGSGVFIAGVPHATHYGPFSMTADASKVIFIKSEKPELSWGTVKKDIEGVYVWNNKSRKIEVSWDRKQLEKLLVADDKNDLIVALMGEIKNVLSYGGSSYLFHLGNEVFLWIQNKYIFRIDLASNSIKPLVRQDLMPSDGIFYAWQVSDGSIRIFQGQGVHNISPNGRIESEWFSADKSIAWSNDVVVYWEKKGLTPVVFDSMGKVIIKKYIQLEQDRFFVSHSGHFGYSLQYKIFSKTCNLKKLDFNGNLKWSMKLEDIDPRLGGGDPVLDHFDGEKVLSLFVGVPNAEMDDTEYYLLSIDSESGKLLKYEKRISRSKFELFGSEEDDQFYCPTGLDKNASMIYCKGGWLCWIPSQGKIRKVNIPQAWEGISRPLGSLLLDRGYGTIAFVDENAVIRPLARRALADALVVVHEGRVIPIPTWLNSGTGTGTYGFGAGVALGSGGVGLGIGGGKPQFHLIPHSKSLNAYSKELTPWAARFARPSPVTLSSLPKSMEEKRP